MAQGSRRVRNINRPAVYGRPQPVRQRKAKPEIKLNLRATLATLALLVLVGWWWQTFSVKQISVNGASAYSPDLVKTAVSAELKQHWWWRNLSLIDTSSLRKQLLASQPQLADVDISRHWPTGLVLKVSERKPNLEWQTTGKTYLLSGEGIIVAEAGQGSNLKLPVVVDSASLPVKLGDQVAPARFIQFSLDMIRLLPKQGLQVASLEVPATTNEVYITTNKGYYIKFDTTRQASAEVGDLAKVLALLKSQNKQPAEYIDLRIDGAAYYK